MASCYKIGFRLSVCDDQHHLGSCALSGTGSPFALNGSLTSQYILNWVKGAKTEYDVDVDYIGVWVRATRTTHTHTPQADKHSTHAHCLQPQSSSGHMPRAARGFSCWCRTDAFRLLPQNERSSDAAYVQTLQKTLASNGFPNVKIVAKDGADDICNDMAKDKAYVS